jgi:hypothetical protein
VLPAVVVLVVAGAAVEAVCDANRLGAAAVVLGVVDAPVVDGFRLNKEPAAVVEPVAAVVAGVVDENKLGVDAAVVFAGAFPNRGLGAVELDAAGEDVVGALPKSDCWPVAGVAAEGALELGVEVAGWALLNKPPVAGV